MGDHNQTNAKNRLRKSIGIGLTLTTVCVAVVIVGDLLSPNVDLPMLGRNPVAWLYYWPSLIWNPPGTMRVGNLDTVASLVVNVIAYSVIAYAALSFRKHSTISKEKQDE
jgi:hypothetical protein